LERALNHAAQIDFWFQKKQLPAEADKTIGGNTIAVSAWGLKTLL
jgi:hypothetical protein